MNSASATVSNLKYSIDKFIFPISIALCSICLIAFGYRYAITGVNRNFWILFVLSLAVAGHYIPKIAAFLIAILVPLYYYSVSPLLAVAMLTVMLIFAIKVPNTGIGRYWVAIFALSSLVSIAIGEQLVFFVIPIQFACLMCLKYSKSIKVTFSLIIALFVFSNLLSTEKPSLGIKDFQLFASEGYKTIPSWRSAFLSLLTTNFRETVLYIFGLLAIIIFVIIISGIISMKLFSKIRRKGIADLLISLLVGTIFSAALYFKESYIDGSIRIMDILLVFMFSVVILGITRVLYTYPIKVSAADETDFQVEDGRGLKKTWDSIAGYEFTKREIQESLVPYMFKDEKKKMLSAGVKPVKGIMLFGPPGTGKTMFARVIAAEAKMNIITVSGSEFVSKYVGESEKNLRDIFRKARESAPCLLFFDELESFLRPRKESRESWDITTVTTFLSEMDGFNELNDVLIIGATNMPNDIDSAAIRPGRFDKIIYVSPPDMEARKAIWSLYLEKKADMTKIDLFQLAEKTDRFTGADIKGIVDELFRANKYNILTQQQILSVVLSIKPTVTLDMQEQYESLALKYTRSMFAQEDINRDKEKRYTWNDIAGMDDTKNIIRQKVEKPLLHAEIYKEMGITPSKGLLMFGPPGCGKTLFAKVIADECKASFFNVNGPSLLRSGIGESETMLRRLFREARENKPAIIFFDEIDSIAEERVHNSSSVRILNQLLTEMDGMENLTGVFVIAATNRPESIDSALKRTGRFDSLLYIGMPDEQSRKKQFQYHLKRICDGVDLDALARKSENFTCADIAGCCMRIAQLYIDKKINEIYGHPENATHISMESIIGIVESFNPTLTQDEIRGFEGSRVHERI